MHVVENPNFPSLLFDPPADLFFAISDLLLKSCAPEKSRLRLASRIRRFAAIRRLQKSSLTCSARLNPESPSPRAFPCRAFGPLAAPQKHSLRRLIHPARLPAAPVAPPYRKRLCP